MEPAPFIVLYGINNLGKSTQAGLLVERLNTAGIKTELVKYPVYELEPTGPQINEILRSGKPQDMTELELQALYAQNRRDYQPTLKAKLDAGITIVAEDYTGTGIAWGVAKGAPLEELERQNADLIREDIGILLDGFRFVEGKEANHLHEKNDTLVERSRDVHLHLAERYGWIRVDANQPKVDVSDTIWHILASNQIVP